MTRPPQPGDHGGATADAVYLLPRAPGHAVDLAEAHSEACFGGKAVALGVALRNGLPVPPGFALDAELSAGVASGEAVARDRVRGLAARLGGLVAVRSSGIGEDGADASFAGQHDTVLGVATDEAVIEAVVRVVRSARNSTDYRAAVGAAQTAAIGVVVQKMLRPDCAGVLFTHDPLSGERLRRVEVVAGLGEALVSGQVTPAWYRFGPGLERLDSGPGDQGFRLDVSSSGGTVRTELQGEAASVRLTEALLAGLDALGAACERAFGGPQDIEWAVEDGRLFLLQARPITTIDPAQSPAIAALARRQNVLNQAAGERVLWSRVNAGEAIPGVVTPLTAAFWRNANRLSMRRHVRRMGVLSAREVFDAERPEDLPGGIFFGRAAGNIEFLRFLGDRLPGSSGDQLELTILGALRPGVTSRKRRGRYPIIFVRMGWLLAVVRGEILSLYADTRAWWRESTEELAAADYDRALAIFTTAATSMQLKVMDLQMIAAQLSPVVWGPLSRIGHRLGSDDEALALTSGLGGLVETEMLDALWETARGAKTEAAFLAGYGYMGPDSGELSSRSWREDQATLRAALVAYADTPPSRRPRRVSEAVQARFADTVERLAGRGGLKDRLALRLAVWFCRRYLPLREYGKSAMTALSDVARAAARRMGVHLAGQSIREPDDVFYLTLEELTEMASAPRDMTAAVAERKALRAYYAALDVPEVFTGGDLQALVGVAARPAQPPNDVDGRVIQGVGVSRGVVRGRARVVLDPSSAADFAKGDILVCRTTDPGWTPLFSIAGAMVVDIGGMLSHSAIIARELGIPAVVNTRNGTREIRDGEELLVDGLTGLVTVA